MKINMSALRAGSPRKTIGQVVKEAKGGQAKVRAATDHIVANAPDVLGPVGRGMKRAGKGAVDTAFELAGAGSMYGSRPIEAGLGKAMGGLVKQTNPAFANAYTGLAPTKVATGLFAAGAGAYAWGASLNADVRAKAEQGQNDFVGSAPIMSGDGIGNRSSAPTLGASGDLVFGLHNRR